MKKRKLNKKRVIAVIIAFILLILTIWLFIYECKTTTKAYNNCLKNNSKEICNELLL